MWRQKQRTTSAKDHTIDWACGERGTWCSDPSTQREVLDKQTKTVSGESINSTP